jgi:hypothetical protein
VDACPSACAAGGVARPRRCPGPLPDGSGAVLRRLGGRRHHCGLIAGGGTSTRSHCPSHRVGPPFAHDGTERRIVRPQDAPQQAAC